MTTPEVPFAVSDFYTDAAEFQDTFLESQADTDCIEKLRAKVQALNNACNFQNAELMIVSNLHYIDWTMGESSQGVVGMEEVPGVFVGRFVGYLVMPMVFPDATHEQPVLSTVLKTTFYHQDIEHYSDIAVVTPIPPATITFFE